MLFKLTLVLLFYSLLAFGNYHESFEEFSGYTVFDKLEEPYSLKPKWDDDKEEYAEGVELTQKALMSYDHINERSKYLTHKIKNMTLGDYTDTVLMFTPLIDGRFKFKVDNFRIKFAPRKNKGSIQYVLNF